MTIDISFEMFERVREALGKDRAAATDDEVRAWLERSVTRSVEQLERHAANPKHAVGEVLGGLFGRALAASGDPCGEPCPERGGEPCRNYKGHPPGAHR
jgi:hypothetical protein